MTSGASNFSFLQTGWPELFAKATRAEKACTADPRAAWARSRAEVAATKAANNAQPDTHNYDEAQARDIYIHLLMAHAAVPNPRQ